jgi:hypothetical protein
MRRISPHDLVRVNLPMTFGRHDDVIAFRVVAVIDAVIAVDPLERAQTRMLPDRVRDCYLTFDNDPSLFALKGHLYQRKPGDWRFRVTDPVSFRASEGFRIRVCAPITVAPLGEDENSSQQTETVNFGPDGVLIDGGPDWSPPERARVTLSLPGEDEPIEVAAALVAREGGLHEFRYESMDTGARNRLGAFIIDYQRDVIRRQHARYRAELGGLDDDLDF